METKLDGKLKEINKLKWLPFVGDLFLKVPNDKRMLIVGESHYYNNDIGSFEKHQENDFTRKVIETMAIPRDYYKTNVFSGLHKAILENDEFDAKKFWNLNSFYNFIQRPMNSTKKERPTYNDFYNDWSVFFNVIEILEPKYCIFIGLEASNTLRDSITETGYELLRLNKDEKISGAYPRNATIIGKKGEEINLFFLRHTSRYFSWSKWNEYLKQKINKQIDWINNMLQE